MTTQAQSRPRLQVTTGGHRQLRVALGWPLSHVSGIIFDRFIMDTAWPNLNQLQRVRDQAGEELELISHAREMPVNLQFSTYPVSS